MFFNTDKQTLDDLNFFGKKGRNSIFSLFNQTNSLGASLLMEQLFQHPSTGLDIIQERSGNIHFFFEAPMDYPVSGSWIDVIVTYLSDRDSRSQLRTDGDHIERKLNSLLGSDTPYKSMVKSLQTLGHTFTVLQAFLENLPVERLSPTFSVLSILVKGILADPEFHNFYTQLDRTKLSYEQVAVSDKFFRFTQYDNVEKILQYLYQLDVYMAIAMVAREKNFSFATIQTDGKQVLDIKGFFHPLLDSPKGNDLHMDDSQRVLFLTGANMAGKSTFMKALGITVFLAHLGLPVPAKHMIFTLYNGIYTTINLADNLEMGYSHFYAEVLRVKKISQELASGKKLFVIFDELFRGTNVKDAYDATVAITAAYANLTNCLFVVSTHIIEASEALKNLVNTIQYAYMPTVMEGSKPRYTYSLTPGVTTDRHGMIIIENERILDILANGKKGGANG